MPMSTPGLSVVPLRSMAGYIHFCQEYFEDVRVPRENLVGEENQGWYIGAALLDFERSGVSNAAGLRRSLDDLVQFCRENGASGSSSGPLPREIRYRIAERLVEIQTGRNLSYRIASLQQAG